MTREEKLTHYRPEVMKARRALDRALADLSLLRGGLSDVLTADEKGLLTAAIVSATNIDSLLGTLAWD